MKKLVFISVLALAAVGCKKESAGSGDSQSAEESHGDVASVTPDELEALMAGNKAHCFDANGPKTRKKYGMVPGAKPLSGSQYDMSELPKDKASKLVFYCSNESCGAAPSAAKKALAAGYTDVSTMPKGIMGWTKAGKKTVAVN